jgi:outer membrane receptor for monomeric catechols
MEDDMLARMLPAVMVAVVAICLADGAFADGGRPHRTPGASSRTANPVNAGLRSTGWKQKTIRALAADPYADRAAPYKANRLSSRPGQPIINIPSQTTILTRQVLDDKNATTVGDALRTTPGVTVGR